MLEPPLLKAILDTTLLLQDIMENFGKAHRGRHFTDKVMIMKNSDWTRGTDFKLKGGRFSLDIRRNSLL